MSKRTTIISSFRTDGEIGEYIQKLIDSQIVKPSKSKVIEYLLKIGVQEHKKGKELK